MSRHWFEFEPTIGRGEGASLLRGRSIEVRARSETDDLLPTTRREQRAQSAKNAHVQWTNGLCRWRSERYL